VQQRSYQFVVVVEVQTGNQSLQKGWRANPITKKGISANPMVWQGASASPINKAGGGATPILKKGVSASPIIIYSDGIQAIYVQGEDKYKSQLQVQRRKYEDIKGVSWWAAISKVHAWKVWVIHVWLPKLCFPYLYWLWHCYIQGSTSQWSPP
jgi:hypothetical protein